ncbi:molybdopterin oxidoreductase [Spirochaetia bacterium]|nr:molybdopterin oxidoreductase [Spirochaetia bacterium]
MREILCIVCPNGCRMSVDEAAPKGELLVSGNLCKRGKDFAEKEIKNPVRTVTSTVRTIFPSAPVLPVRTSAEIPKEKIFDLMRFLGGICLDKPLETGEIVAHNVLGLDCDIIATGSIPKEIEYE